MRISAFFRDVLKAKLANTVWSWGTVRPDTGQVFLRVWNDEIDTIARGDRVFVLGEPTKAARTRGSKERARHVEMLSQGSKGYGVVCFRDTKPGEKATIKSYDDRNLLEFGETFQERGKTYVMVARRVSVANLSNATTLTDTPRRHRKGTALVAKSIQSGHQAAYTKRAKAAIPILVDRALSGLTIFYGDLAAELGVERGRNMNYVLGCVGTTLDEFSEIWREDIPLLQALAVNKATNLPGSGFESTGRAELKLAAESVTRRERFEAIWTDVSNYVGWPRILNELGLPPSSGLSDAIQDIWLEKDKDLSPTEKKRLRDERVGQQRFRWRVGRIERRCRVTKISQQVHLRASHIKPWAVCSVEEKCDGFNGLFLAPHIDHLFDRGYISFSDDGRLLVASKCDRAVLLAWRVREGLQTGPFHKNQKRYLEFHRNAVFKG